MIKMKNRKSEPISKIPTFEEYVEEREEFYEREGH